MQEIFKIIINYLNNQIYSFLSVNAIFLFDDINWLKDMQLTRETLENDVRI